jgi:iron complex transport system substrate-binding protein
MKALYLVVFLLAVSCTNSPDTKKYNSFINVCQYSKWLKISESQEAVLIQIQNPDDTAKIYSIRLPNFKSNVRSGAYDFEEPIQRLACLSSTHIGMLAELDLRERIVAVSSLKYVYNPKLKSSMPTALGEEQGIDVEKVVNSKAEIIIYSAFSSSFAKEKVLNKVGVECIPNFDWREIHPLGRAEWMLFFGYLTGYADEAKLKFKEICENYEGIKSNAGTSRSLRTLSGNITGDFWYAPAGESYHAQLLRDAGLNYVFSGEPGTGSLSYSFEKIVGLSQGIELWLNPGFKSKQEILQAHPKSRLLPILEQSSLFCYTHNSNKYWELSACRPDLVLADYSELKKRDKMNPNELFFYKRVE